MAASPPAGWYPQVDGTQRYWDGLAWTHHVSPSAGGAETRTDAAPANREQASRRMPTMSREQIAHDLAIAYLNNRYGPEVTGEFSVTADQDWSGDSPRVTDVTGSGEVRTENLPRVDKIRMDRVEVRTGERGFFGLGPEKVSTVEVDSGEFEVDPVFKNMIRDYFEAYFRFVELLERSA
ncbi:MULTISPECIES: DUF2510 domain-containing protein [Microbacterium]|uniref:DUF2510 domain-containing protein n=1 Tax=Microbacterium imperiale TaxID=33884 RepID=A0A9W6HHT4_9MICO|nr:MULTISPECIES: DUF2510 domain-containing protein [Microbacterium]MBP2421562.1 hypothetical protein [Microbacterium imperiale]MDD7928830.1 DUF2510 domain-containing protein [Microbacterium thalli]MDS0199331.1 DUF2510 domain-containing protein [Microbacterium imperiale]BFE41902.1 hypothetical protein GCM10017544_28580 [Microbacterium imperiale]GLJ80854.1 hypothetical protein GCM10017586_25370 [Microbacterium imperiale]